MATPVHQAAATKNKRGHRVKSGQVTHAINQHNIRFSGGALYLAE